LSGASIGRERGKKGGGASDKEGGVVRAVRLAAWVADDLSTLFAESHACQLASLIRRGSLINHSQKVQKQNVFKNT